MNHLARTANVASAITELQQLGQSIWLDDIRRRLLTSGELTRLVETSGVTGVTANPAIFEKAIVESNDYEDASASLVRAIQRKISTISSGERNGA